MVTTVGVATAVAGSRLGRHACRLQAPEGGLRPRSGASPLGVWEARRQRLRPPERDSPARGRAVAGNTGGRETGRGQRPSSNTTSSETETLLSPGATGVLSKASAFIIAIRGIGIGALPPSPMLTIRRTRRPSALA